MTKSVDRSPRPTARGGTEGASGESSGAAHPDRTTTDPPVDRTAALAAGAPGIPRKFIYWILAAAGVLSLGGLVGEHLFSSTGLNPVSAPAPAKPKSATTTHPAAQPTPLPTSSPQPVSASLQSLMGLTRVPPAPAPPFSLIDQGGQATVLPLQSPKVVVLTFFDGSCNDICPVLAAEIREADTDLGAEAKHVEFLTVNTDPLALAQSAQSPAVTDTGLSALPNWRMLTGPLVTLNIVWKAYGVSISVDQKTDLEAHNEVLYFIDPSGDLRFKATPFANESTTGTYSLPAATIADWADGIAAYAGQLAAP